MERKHIQQYASPESEVIRLARGICFTESATGTEDVGMQGGSPLTDDDFE